MLKYGMIGLVLFLLFEGVTIQRKMSVAEQDVEAISAQVQNVLSRQAELIPNLAEVAKGYAKHEQDTFAKVAAFRSGVENVANSDPANVTKSIDAQQKLAATVTAGNQALMAMKMVREAYPELKANENFSRLMTELEGSINRVTVERRKLQMAIRDYNKEIVQFPTNVVAGMIGYHAMPFYQAPESDQRAPKLNFGMN